MCRQVQLPLFPLLFNTCTHPISVWFMLQSCCDLSLGKLPCPEYKLRAGVWGTGSTGDLTVHPWKMSPVKLQRHPQTSRSYQNTHVQQHCPLKRHQLCYSLCSVTLFLGEKWNYPTMSPTARNPALPWCEGMYRALHIEHKAACGYGHHECQNKRESWP